MDPRLDENEAELGVLVLAVALEVLADSDGLYDKVGRSVLKEPKLGLPSGDDTFLMSMYRSSGSSGARPVSITLSALTEQRREEISICMLCVSNAMCSRSFEGGVPEDLRIRRILLPNSRQWKASG